MRRIKDTIQHVFEYLLALAFMLSTYGTIAYSPAPEEVGAGVLGFLFSDPHVLLIYGVWFSLMAVGLLYSKWFKKKRLHKWTLAAMYLTTVYTITLTLAAFGLDGYAVLDDGIIGAAAAICWLRWKLLTEYIDPNEFMSDVEELRDDLPST